MLNMEIHGVTVRGEARDLAALLLEVARAAAPVHGETCERCAAITPEPAVASAPEPVEASNGPVHRVVVPAAGSKYARVVCEVDGKPVEVAGCVADLLRTIAHGARRVRTRPETVRKLQDCLPWLAAQLERDYSSKVISNKHVYAIPNHFVHQIEGAGIAEAARIGWCADNPGHARRMPA